MGGNNGFSVLRDSVNGENKYCRILIRRRRASIADAIAYFSRAVRDLDAACAQCSEQDQAEFSFRRACCVTALAAIRTHEQLEQDLSSTREALNAALEQLHKYADCKVCVRRDRSAPSGCGCMIGGCCVDGPDLWEWNGGETDGKR